MAERVGHEREAAPQMRGNRPLQRRAGGDGFIDRRFDIVNDEVEMNRRPVPFEGPPLRGRRGYRGAGALHEQIYGRRTPEHLHAEVARASPDRQTEGGPPPQQNIHGAGVQASEDIADLRAAAFLRRGQQAATEAKLLEGSNRPILLKNSEL
jgi:hypothetical protein